MTCGYAGCPRTISTPSPHLTICKLRWHLERDHTDLGHCPLCACYVDVSYDTATLSRHMDDHEKKTKSPTLPQHLQRLTGNIRYKCPCGLWQSPPLPIAKAYALYIQHCADYHSGGLACAFCSELFPGWGPLAFHVRKFCPQNHSYPHGEHPLFDGAGAKLGRRKN